MREKRVVVAVVQDAEGRFLVLFNPKWDGYAFPMKDLEDDADILGSAAIEAVESDLGRRLPKAKAEELEYLGRIGDSGRTGEQTQYEYWVFAVDPGEPLDLKAASVGQDHPPIFLRHDELTSRTDLTWSTSDIAREFVENQEAVLSVVTRAGVEETEFLLVWNDNYGGYFFPTRRVKSEVKPDRVAIGTVRSDLGYRGPVTAEWLGEVPDVHFSNRFHLDRRYRFHVCDVLLPEVDLHQPNGLLEQSLQRRGRRFVWLPGSKLNDHAISFSKTMAAVRSSVLQLIPKRTVPNLLRHSEGGIALIQRTLAGKSEWLAQWNENWKAFFFVGGHRHPDETFRDCVIREIGEELGLSPGECPVAPSPRCHLEYFAISRSANELTAYTMELFDADPTLEALDAVARNSANKWLDEVEIRRLEAHDGRPVSVSMGVIMSLGNFVSVEMELPKYRVRSEEGV